MPLLTDNFDTDTLNANPTGWVGAPAASWGVVAGGLPATGRCMSVTGSGSTNGSGTTNYFSGASWSSMTVTCVMQCNTAPSAEAGVLLSVRTSGNTVIGYVASLRFNQDQSSWLSLRRIGQSPAILGGVSGVYPNGGIPALADWIWIKAAYDPSSSTLRVKMWKDGQVEPANWNATVTENTLTGPGYAGLFNEGANSFNYDQFTVDGFIAGSGAPVPTITGFTPIAGVVGDQVTITGTNFGASVGLNSVMFNGVLAQIVSATTTQLVAQVPAGASTGPIAVTTPGGTAYSTTNFTVTPAATGGSAPTITTISPTSGPVGTVVTITGTNFDQIINNDQVTFNMAVAGISTATTTQIVATVPPTATTGPVGVKTFNGSVLGPTFTVTGGPTGGGGGTGAPAGDAYLGAEDDSPLSPSLLLPYLRAMLKDTAPDMQQLGIKAPTWDDHELYRYLELARGEYGRHRPKRAHTILSSVALQQNYTVSSALRITDVLWAPAGYDMDQISALAAALAGGPGLLWGGGVPVVGRVYFDSPASIQVWSIIREAWRNTFGGHWLPGDTPNTFNLVPVPQENALNILVLYTLEVHWADVPWQHRNFLLTRALLFAIEGMSYQIIAGSTAMGVKLGYGTRALVQLIEAKYNESLDIRPPGVTAGRS